MTSQILDKDKVVVATSETKLPKTARMIYARAKYFCHSGSLPKSDVVSAPEILTN